MHTRTYVYMRTRTHAHMDMDMHIHIDTHIQRHTLACVLPNHPKNMGDCSKDGARSTPASPSGLAIFSVRMAAPLGGSFHWLQQSFGWLPQTSIWKLPKCIYVFNANGIVGTDVYVAACKFTLNDAKTCISSIYNCLNHMSFADCEFCKTNRTSGAH